MIVLSLDTETTISNKGNPHDQTNKLCAIAGAGTADSFVLKVEHGEEPYGDGLRRLRDSLCSVDLLVLFNGKFDLNWLYKYGIDLSSKRVWDCQLFEYMASNQEWTYPDLKTAGTRRGLSISKETEIEEYWEAGIDTTDIPWEVIEKRVSSDAKLTYQLYKAQLEEFNTWPQARQNLFRLHCADLMVLHEIERNGVYYDEEASKEEARKTSARILDLDLQIKAYAPVDPSLARGSSVEINLNSPQQVSGLLYGGVLEQPHQVQVGFYKTGARAGQPKFKTEGVEVRLPRLIEPLDGTKLQLGEFWSTDQKVLGRLLNTRLLAKAKKLLTLILQYSKEQRSLSSYTQGLPNLIKKMNWPTNMLYGQVNQCAVVTGRTSASQPNLQNFSTELKHLFKSRFI